MSWLTSCLFGFLVYHIHGLELDLWEGGRVPVDTTSLSLLTDKNSASCMSFTVASFSHSNLLLRITDSNKPFDSVNLLLVGIDFSCCATPHDFFTSVTVLAMESGLSKYQPFSERNYKCELIPGTKCTFHCQCPRLCHHVAVHMTPDIIMNVTDGSTESRSARLCEVMMIHPGIVTPAMLQALDSLAVESAHLLDEVILGIDAEDDEVINKILNNYITEATLEDFKKEAAEQVEGPVNTGGKEVEINNKTEEAVERVTEISNKITDNVNENIDMADSKLKNIESVVNGTSENVNEILSNTGNILNSTVQPDKLANKSSETADKMITLANQTFNKVENLGEERLPGGTDDMTEDALDIASDPVKNVDESVKKSLPLKPEK